MLVALAQDVCRDIALIGELNTILQDAGAIRDTLEGVSRVQESVKRLDTLLSLLHQRLPYERVQQFLFRIDVLRQEVETSHKNFETEPRQTKHLSQLYTKAKQMIAEIDVLWMNYVQQQTEQPFELLKLVLYLPEVQTQYSELTSLQKQLGDFSGHSPHTIAQLTNFDHALRDLIQRLGNIEGLDSEIRIFLQKSLAGLATIGDLTEKILQWCQQAQHAHAFAIRFTLYKERD